MSSVGPPPRWKWTQISGFQHPTHNEWDLIQWDLEDELVLDPRKVSHHLSGDWFYMRTKEAPGLGHLPAFIVVFRIVSEPTDHAPGVIEGHRVFREDLLEKAIGKRAATNGSSPF